MNIKKLIETQEILWQKMRDNDYCRDYLMSYYRELRWIEANVEKYNVSSYEELCKIRLQNTKPYKVSLTKTMFGTFNLKKVNVFCVFIRKTKVVLYKYEVLSYIDKKI